VADTLRLSCKVDECKPLNIGVLKDAAIGGGLEVDGATALHNTAVAGTLAVTSATTLSSTLGVTGATTLSSTLGVTGATTLSSAALSTTLNVTGATTLTSAALSGDITMTKTAAALTHTGAASTDGLTITSSNGFVVVEDVRFTGASIGIRGDTDMITLTADTVTVDGAVSSTTLTSTGATTAGYLGVNGVADISGTLTLSGATHAVTHTGTTGLVITSTGGYVDVEDVRFTGASIGVSGDTDLITLSNAHVIVAGSVTIEDTLGRAVQVEPMKPMLKVPGSLERRA